MASRPGPKTETVAPTAAAAAATESGDPVDEDEDAAAEAVAEETPAAGDDSADKDGDGDGDGGDVKVEKNGSDNEPEANGVESKTEAAAEGDKTGGNKAAVEQGTENGKDTATSNGKARHGSPEGKKEKAQEQEEGVDVYRRDMAWLQSAHGMVAEVRKAVVPFFYRSAVRLICSCIHKDFGVADEYKLVFLFPQKRVGRLVGYVPHERELF